MSQDIPAKKLYRFIDEFETQHEFAEFARSDLRLSNREINDIISDHTTSSREQKYQMLSKWKRKEGRRATIQKLYQLKAGFDRQDEGNDGEGNNHPIGGSVPLPGFFNQLHPANLPQRLTADNEPADDESSGPSSMDPAQLNERQRSATPESANPNRAGSRPSSGDQRPSLPHSPYNRNIARIETRNGRGGIGDQRSSVGAEPEIAKACDRVESVNVKNCTPPDIAAYEERDDTYPIKCVTKGYVLIVNNNFKGASGERNGADKDVANMSKLWKDLGCRTKVLEDITAKEIMENLRKLSLSRRVSNFDFIAIFIMSHGELQDGSEVFLGSDNQPVKVEHVLSLFDNNSCTHLAGIPKLFFFQFCRGVIIDTGTPHPDNDNDLEDVLSSLRLRSYETDGPLDECDAGPGSGARQPFRSDLLISYATQSGYLSYRNMDGSWFINAIAHIFMKHARTDHVADLMTKVREAVSAKDGKTRISDTQRVNCKEMSETRNLLRKKLYLMPGYPKDDPLDD